MNVFRLYSPDGGAAAPAAVAPAAASPAPAADAGAAAPANGKPAAPVAFAETLPEAIRGEAAFADIKSLDDLAKSYLNAQKLIGVPKDKLLRLPDAPDAAEWGDVWNRLGRPESPDKYDLKTPDGIQEDPAFKNGFLSRAHEAGLNGRQAAQLFDWYIGEATTRMSAAQAEARQRADSQIAALKTEWGTAFDQKLETAKLALAHYGGEDLAKYLNETGLGNDPRVARMFARMGEQLREDGVIGRGGPAGNFLSPAEAQQQINKLSADPAFSKAYLDKRHPGHADAVARMQQLYEQKAAASAA